MGVIKRRKTSLVEEIEQSTLREPIAKKDFDFKKMISTGSTLLDLAISGGRCRNGGIPGGIITEIFGPSGSGKTSILSEIGASVQQRDGEVMFLDPEARLDQEYARIYQIQLAAKNYYRPNTVTEVFEKIFSWQPDNNEAINLIATDSLAALSTELELEKGDKMGMRRAKEFSEGLRKTARIIANNNWIIGCTNQVRDGAYGETTPGGQAIPFYSSLRIRVAQQDKVIRSTKISNKEVKKVIGIKSTCFIKKSTVDDPYREADIYIVFGYGIDDIRGNLQYMKDMKGNTVYDCIDGKTYQSIDKAIAYIEDNNLETKLRDNVINLWNEIEEKFKTNRQKKDRS